MIRGIDCSAPVTMEAARILAAEGYAFVGRYLVPESYSKALTRREAEIISDAGLRILSVWETTAARMRGGAAAGWEDGARALDRAWELEIPRDSILYFAADFEAVRDDLPAIQAYIQEVKAEILPYYRAGIYGSYRVIEAMRGTVSGLWQCVAWSGGKISDDLTVYQAQWQGTAECRALAAMLGFAVDINTCPDMDRAGMWSYQQVPAAEPETGEEEMDVDRYNSIDELPKWAKPTVKKLIDRGFLRGTGGKRDKEGYPTGLDLSEDMVRLLVINDRAGVFDA